MLYVIRRICPAYSQLQRQRRTLRRDTSIRRVSVDVFCRTAFHTDSLKSVTTSSCSLIVVFFERFSYLKLHFTV